MEINDVYYQKKVSAPSMENGVDILSRLELLLQIYPTGSQSLDELLDGGIWTGEIIEIVGTESAGKTQLCYSLIGTVLLRTTDTSVLYLDVNGSFRPKRLVQIIRSQQSDPYQDISTLLSRVIIQRPTNSLELYQCLEHIKAISDGRNVRVLVVDNVGSLLSLTVLGQQSTGWHLQSVISRQLKRIASEDAVAVIVINHLVFPWKGPPRPALGQWWASTAHTRLTMIKVEDEDSVTLVELVKCVRKSTGSKVKVRIVDRGVVDAVATDYRQKETEVKECSDGEFSDYEGDSPIF